MLIEAAAKAAASKVIRVIRLEQSLKKWNVELFWRGGFVLVMVEESAEAFFIVKVGMIQVKAKRNASAIEINNFCTLFFNILLLRCAT